MIRYLLVLVLAAAAPITLANAQSRDVYTIRDIAVDERASSLIEARQKAFSAAKYAGAKRMIARITLPEDLAAADTMIIDQAVAEMLAAAVDVESEVAGAGRYRGSLAVVFNPANVRVFLDQNEVPYIDQPAPKAVLIPISNSGNSIAWNMAWDDDSVGHLAPTITSRSSGYDSDVEWDDISGDAALYGAQRGILAQLSGSAGSYRVKVSSVTPSGVRELGTTPRTASLNGAVEATGALLDTSWKRSSVIRDTSRTMIEATVMYTSLAEWNTLRGALAKSPLVSDFKTKAVSTDGAVVAFIFAGDGQRLTSDLRDRGVLIRMDTIGWVMTSAVTSRR